MVHVPCSHVMPSVGSVEAIVPNRMVPLEGPRTGRLVLGPADLSLLLLAVELMLELLLLATKTGVVFQCSQLLSWFQCVVVQIAWALTINNAPFCSLILSQRVCIVGFKTLRTKGWRSRPRNNNRYSISSPRMFVKCAQTILYNQRVVRQLTIT